MIFRTIITTLLILTLSACQSSGGPRKTDEDISKRAGLHYRLGIDALNKGLLPKAFEELILSDSILSDQPATLGALAYSWRLRGNNKEAQKYYKKALRNDAGPATHNNYGNLLIELGKYKEAIKELKTALEDPRYDKQDLAFTNLGDAFVGLNDFEAGIAAYRQAQMLAPNWTYPKLREASAYVKFNRPNYAQALYETILRKDPTSQQALLGLIQQLKGKPEANTLKKYLQTFMDKTNDPLQKAWAKDEYSSLGFK